MYVWVPDVTTVGIVVTIKLDAIMFWFQDDSSSILVMYYFVSCFPPFLCSTPVLVGRIRALRNNH